MWTAVDDFKSVLSLNCRSEVEAAKNDDGEYGGPENGGISVLK